MNFVYIGILEDPEVQFIMVSHKSWLNNEHVQCTIVRDRSSISSKMYPTYALILDAYNKTLLVAKKMTMNVTSNYHLFDMTRGTPGSTLTKKSCNYIGKLRSLDTASKSYVIVTSAMKKEEIGGVKFERQTVVNHIKEGSQPRKFEVVVPDLDSNNVPIPRPADSGCILDEMDGTSSSGSRKFHSMQSKAPVFENGNFRLNFRGRVTTPSVKNFQLTPADDVDEILMLFGKCAEDRYHMDYKAPLNAVQAFCIALTQFNV